MFIWWDETENYNKIEHEYDNEIVNYIKNLKNKDIEINTEDLLEFSK